MYKETQKFRQPWLWVLLLCSLGVVLYRWQPAGVAIMLGILGLFWSLALDTQINEAGIAYRWLPVQKRYRHINWADIEQITVRDYAAITEYGGWGIRFSLRGMAHTVSGHHGIELKRKGHKRTLLIGTQRPDKIRQFIEQNHSVGV